MKKNRMDLRKLIILAAGAIVAIMLFLRWQEGTGSVNAPEKGKTASNSAVIDDDIVISVKDVTETASFYPAKINGTELEVIAVKASDGTVRTAFNTCQVCYNSGRGYYKQDGNRLVCQNCGNRFGMDDVEITRGGCNPVPITSEYKETGEETITISKDFLTEATVIFQNWSK
ncbi:putative membrane protein [Anaerotaenia torta]|uniref:Fe-S-containing protein n=1 Tax=Anaerotaenia torta TaxID=433293 RepID=UPI003D23A4A8